jgi:hypothetical protein
VRKEHEMTIVQEILQRDRTEASFVAGLKTKSTQELRRFIAGPWTASILSPGEIEELYQTLRQRERSLLDWTTEDFVEMAQD